MSRTTTASAAGSKRSVRQSLVQLRGVMAYALGPILGLITGPLLAQQLGPHGRGQFAGIMEPITVAGVIAAFGAPSAVAHFIARGNDPRTVWRSGLTLTAITGIAVYVAMGCYAIWVSHVLSLPWWFVVVVWIAIPIGAIVQTRRSAWQGLGEWWRLDLERALFASTRTIGVVVLAVIGVTQASWYIVIAVLPFALVSGVLFCGLPKRPGTTATEAAVRIGPYAGAAAIGAIAMGASNRLDQLLMPSASTTTELGFYAVAVTVAEVPLVLASVASRNILHAASAGHSFASIWRRSWLPLVGCAAGIVVLEALVGPVIPFFFGAEFRASVAPTQVLLLATGVNALAIAFTAYLSGVGRPWIGSIANVAGALAVVIAFTASWGSITAISASWITLVSQSTVVVLCLLGVWRAARGPRTPPLSAADEAAIDEETETALMSE